MQPTREREGGISPPRKNKKGAAAGVAYLLRSGEGLALKRQHGLVLVEARQRRAVGVEGVVIVIGERLQI